MTPRTLFYCALMRLDALNAERWAITGDLQTELNALIVAEARKLKPKSKKLKAPAPPSLFARPKPPEGTYADMAFANGVVGTERCDELAKPFLDRQTEEHAKIDTQVKETKETLALAAEEAPIEPGEPGELRLYERVWSSTYSTQGYGAISYARRDAETALAHALRYGVMGEIRETERTKGWSGTDSCTFEVWVQVKGQLDVEILTRKPPPPYAEQVRDCWARGCNPRVFDGSSGRRPSAEARRYVYMIIAAMLENELRPDEKDGWMFGGIDNDFDKRRLVLAIKAVRQEMLRKGDPAR